MFRVFRKRATHHAPTHGIADLLPVHSGEKLLATPDRQAHLRELARLVAVHIVPAAPIPDSNPADSADEEKKAGHYIHWPLTHLRLCYAALGHPVRRARLLKRVFGIDLESCPNCGSPPPPSMES